MSEQDTIKERAIKIVISHVNNPDLEIIKQIDSDNFTVKSYILTFDYDEGWICSCPYNTHKGECKHILAVKMCKEQGIHIPLEQSYKEY